MFGDGSDRVNEIRARSGSDIVQVGVSPADPGAVSGAVAPEAEAPIFGLDFRSPWLRDRVTLSLEAQIAMLEMRSTYRLTLADLGYANKTNIMEIRPGIYCAVEPTGGYRLAYNNRELV